MKPFFQNNLFLVGPMGAGKSSIGRFLARYLNKKFFDTDQEIEKRTGVNINWIFDLEGEEGFREREATVIAELTRNSNIVLATGGGCIQSPENCRLLNKYGVVIYLKVSLECQLKRLVMDYRRPLLHAEDREAVLTRMVEEREKLYRQVARITVDTDNRSVAAVSSEIARYFESPTVLEFV